MPQSAAYNTTLKLGDDPTTLTNAACTKITPNTVYRITDATKRVLDPDTAVVVESDPLGTGVWGVIAATVDYFTGTVTVAAQLVTALVRVSGKYIPLVDVLYAKSASFTQTTAKLETTDFQSAGWREYIIGLAEGALSFEVVSAAAEDLGPGTLMQALASRGEVFVEYQPGGQGYWYRFWALLDSRAANTPIDALVGSTLTAVMTTRDPAAGFSLSDVGTT